MSFLRPCFLGSGGLKSQKEPNKRMGQLCHTIVSLQSDSVKPPAQTSAPIRAALMKALKNFIALLGSQSHMLKIRCLQHHFNRPNSSVSAA